MLESKTKTEMKLFRVWCKNKKEWEQDRVVLSSDGQIYQLLYGRPMPLKKETHLLDPGTHLRDVNGKQLFSNDVVLFTRYGFQPTDGAPKKEVFQHVCHVIWVQSEGKYRVKMFDETRHFCTCSLGFKDNRADSCQFEIIGNTRANPELIEGYE